MKKAIANRLLVLLLAACLPGCDVQPDKPTEAEGSESEADTSTDDEISLVSSGVFPKGARMEQSRQVMMNHLGMTITQGADTAKGAANIIYREPREVEVMSSSVWKILIGDAKAETSTTLRGQDEKVSNKPALLSNVTVIRDGDRAQLEGVPTDEQKEALKSFEADWFGGNDLFPDKPVKLRDTWELKPDLLLSAVMGREFADCSGKATLSLKKIFTFDNEETAEIVVSMSHLKGTMREQDGRSTEVELDGFGSLYRSLKNLHTTRANLKGTVTLNTKGPERAVNFSGPFECRASSDVTLP